MCTLGCFIAPLALPSRLSGILFLQLWQPKICAHIARGPLGAEGILFLKLKTTALMSLPLPHDYLASPDMCLPHEEKKIIGVQKKSWKQLTSNGDPLTDVTNQRSLEQTLGRKWAACEKHFWLKPNILVFVPWPTSLGPHGEDILCDHHLGKM